MADGARLLGLEVYSSTSTWNEEICDEQLRAMLEDTTRRVKQDDPAKSRRYFVSEVATVRVDASSLAAGQ